MPQAAATTDNIAPFAKSPTPERKKPRRARCRLVSVSDVHAEAAAIYRQWKSGLLDSQELSRAASVLAIIARLVSESEIEERLAQVEEAMRSNNWRRGA